MKKEAEGSFLDPAALKTNQTDIVASIRRGLAQVHYGAGRPIEEMFDDLEREDASG